MPFRSIVCVLAALAAAGPSRVAAQSVTPDAAARAAVHHAVQVWGRVHTVRATFEQRVTNALTGSSADAHGEYQQERPGRLAVRFQDPDGDAIVADGKYLWLYLPSGTPGQVIRQRETAAGSGTVDLTGQFLDDPFTRYTITDAGADTVDGRAARAVVLVPRPGGPTDFSRAKVWIDDGDGYIRQFEVSQTDGVMRRIHLTALHVNVPVSAAAFRFVVPRGVRVVDR